MNKFAINFKELRTQLGFTQKELADKLNTTERSVRSWEKENREPIYDTLIKIAEVFDVTIDELLGRE